MVSGRRLRAWEVTLVVGGAIGLSALRSVLDFLAAALSGVLSAQSAVLNASLAPRHAWIDLGLQLVFVLSLLTPVGLALVLVARDGAPWATIGLRPPPWRRDVLLGLAAAAAVGGLGLAAYLTSYALGFSLTVVPTTLPSVWWRVPVLVLSALANAALEEVVLVGYLLRRLEQLGWGPREALGISAGLRGFYHLYQGLAGLLGNAVMGGLFGWYFQRRRTILPQLVAHASIDIVVFVGYLLLVGHVGWLPLP